MLPPTKEVCADEAEVPIVPEVDIESSRCKREFDANEPECERCQINQERLQYLQYTLDLLTRRLEDNKRMLEVLDKGDSVCTKLITGLLLNEVMGQNSSDRK